MKHRFLLFFSAFLINAGLSASPTCFPCDDSQNDWSSDFIKTENCSQSYFSDVFVNAAFTYWQADQEGLDIANSGVVARNGIGGFVIASSRNSHVLDQDFDYAPGFKVGIGAKVCGCWDLLAEYTWFRNTNHLDCKTAPHLSTCLDNVKSVWVLNDWFIQTTDQGQTIAASKVSSKWRLEIDLLDASVGHSFCASDCYGVSMFFGLRWARIDQNFNVCIHVPQELIGSVNSVNGVHSKNKSSSWGIGPRIGVNNYYLLGKGFRIQGDLALSLLYTEYKVSHHEDVAAIDLNPSILNTKLHDYNTLKPNLEMTLALGWNTCVCNCMVDFLVAYDFMIFWGQNMNRKLMDQTINGSSASAGNLNLQGLRFNCVVNF